MSDYSNLLFAELNDKVAKGFTYTPMTDERFMSSYLDDVSEIAEKIAGQWNGDEAGREEDRATIANEIMDKCAEIKELISQLEEL